MRVDGNPYKLLLNFIFSFVSILLMGPAMSEQSKIVYIEASTGNRWKLQDFAKRTNTGNVDIEFHALYEFDKTPVLEKVLSDNQKPDSIVIQECSVYFPGDFENYKKQYASWIDEIKARGIEPVIATTVPPARSMGFVQDTKNFIKKYVLGRESQYEQVVKFNNWLREYANENNVKVLDLESKMRVSDSERHMKAEYDSGDGIHLNKKAYEVLDDYFRDFLTR